MTNLRSVTLATAVALTACLSLTACGEDSGSGAKVTLADWGAQGGPRDWATPGPLVASTASRKTVVMPRLSFTPGDKGNVATQDWPDAKDLLTQDALKAMFPDGKDIETTDCGKGTFDGDAGKRSEKDNHCTYAVTLPNDQGGKSKLKLSIRAVGAEDALTKNFERENGDLLNSDRGKGGSTDRVWKNGAFGAKRLVKSSSEYRFVVSDGKVGMYYVATFDGFFVLGQSMGERQNGVERELLPVVVQDLASRLPAG